MKMVDADSLVLPIAGSIIIMVIGLMKLLGDKYIKTFDDRFISFENSSKKILNALDDIKNQISDLKTENQLQTAALREVEGRVEVRFQGIERRLDAKRQMIGQLENRIELVEKDLGKIKLFHSQHHPDDRIRE